MSFEAFTSRSEAGRKLARRLVALALRRPVVLALPRGGVPVAVEIATALKAPLDLILVRKIGVPGQRELAAAAVVDGDRPEIVYNDEVMAMTGLERGAIDRQAEVELAEIERRRAAYLGARKPVAVAGRDAVVVDDGIATGTTTRAALQALRRRDPRKLILAVPVAPPDTVAALEPLVDTLVCLQQPEPFYAISTFYRDFHQVGDHEVVELLAQAGRPE